MTGRIAKSPGVGGRAFEDSFDLGRGDLINTYPMTSQRHCVLYIVMMYVYTLV